MSKSPAATYKQKLDSLFMWANSCGTPILCALCKKPIYPGQRYEIDHSHAKARGGKNTVSNLFPVHDEKEEPFNCHDRKTFGGNAKATTLGSDVHEAAKTKRLERETALHRDVMAGKVEREPSRLQGKGFERRHRPMDGSRGSAWKRGFNGKAERRA